MLLRLMAFAGMLVLGLAIVFVALSGRNPAGEAPAIAVGAGAAPAGAAAAEAPVAGRSPVLNEAGNAAMRETAAVGGPVSRAPAIQAPAPEPIGGPFRLATLDGAEVTEAALVGRTSLIFFGFTNCRADCPPLAAVGGWLNALGDAARGFGIYYVTVDPDRDDAAALAAFLSPFDDRIVGLTGTGAAIEAMLAAYRVDHARLPGGPSGYDVEHPAYAYVVGTNGAYAGRIAYGEAETPATIRQLRGLAIATYDAATLDALCRTLRADRRDEALATYPTSLWRTCAERGFAEAQLGLALMLDEGNVLPRNVADAYVWAVRAGHAVSALTARLQEEMRPLEVAAAIERAQDWTPTR
ncbi:MAG: SCO family protein [Bauldia sp.]